MGAKETKIMNSNYNTGHVGWSPDFKSTPTPQQLTNLIPSDAATCSPVEIVIGKYTFEQTGDSQAQSYDIKEMNAWGALIQAVGANGKTFNVILRENADPIRAEIKS